MKNDKFKEFLQLVEQEQKKNKARIDESRVEDATSTEQTDDRSFAEIYAASFSSSVSDDVLVTLNEEPSIPESPKEIEQNRWNDPLAVDTSKFVTFEALNDHYGKFLGRIQQQLSSLGGGGEVNFRYLDDVNRATMGGSNDNWVLEYDTATGKVQFTNEIGPIEIVKFDTLHDVTTHPHQPGYVCWNNEDQTLNIFHDGGVIQQVGQEQYAYVRNNTGAVIENGTVVQFAGADQYNGAARLEISPFLADGTYPSLYTLGVTTQDFQDGEDGRVTIWGKVRGLDASGAAVSPPEEWQVGDILYAHPTDAGKLTKFKPTSPNNVVPIAAVLDNGTADGEIFIRPTIEQRYDYATISSTETQTIALANQAQEITFNNIQNDLGVSYDGTDTSKLIFDQSGLYTINFNTQALSSNSSSKNVYFWIRKNGVDVPYSARIKTLVGNGVYSTFHITYNVSLVETDYIQFMWASTDPAVSLEAAPATAFSPTSPSVYLHIDQAAL